MAHATTRNIGTRRIRQGGLLVAAAGLGVTAFGIPAAIAQVPENLICAFVWDDVDGDGVIDEGEQPIANVWINLRLGMDPWTVLGGGLTDGDGEVCFEVDPEGGPYKLEELDPEGYESTTPNSYYPIVPGEQQIWDFGDRLPEEPTDPTVPPTTDPTVPPTDPSVPPTDPSVPPTEPSVPPTEPSVPPTAATVPTTVATTVTEPLSVTTQVPTTVATTVATTAATTSTTAAPTTTVLSTLTATPTAAPATVAVLAGTLPRTGGDPGLALAGMGMIVVGGLMTAVRRKPS